MLIFAIYTYALLTGFFFYAGVMAAWPRLLFGIKLLVAPVVLIFGVADIVFDTVFGSVMYLELPGWFSKRFTFSQRCEHHMSDAGFRGVIAGAYCFTLNTVVPGHCRTTI
jgi:hypothetical protein